MSPVLKSLLAALALTVSSLSGAQQPARGGTLTIALPTEPAHLNSAIDTTQQVKAVAGKVYSGLLKYDLRMNMQPDLAESWSMAPDGRTTRPTKKPPTTTPAALHNR